MRFANRPYTGQGVYGDARFLPPQEGSTGPPTITELIPSNSAPRDLRAANASQHTFPRTHEGPSLPTRGTMCMSGVRTCGSITPRAPLS